VPAGTTAAIVALPAGFGRFVRLGRLPEHEIERILLAGGHGHALAGPQVVEALAAQASVAGKAAHTKEGVAIVGAVGIAVLLQQADEVEHLRHVVGGARFEVRALDAECGLVFLHGGDEAGSQAADGLAVLHRTTDDLVVDVGDVAHIGDLIATCAQPALHHIEGHQHAGMTDVAVVIHRHATHIQPHLARVQGFEGFFASGEGVVELQCRGHGGGRDNRMKRTGGRY
jgi:hypothetical protein